LKICVVTGTFHPEIGGPPTYLYHLLPALVERGHEITVVTYGDVAQEFEYPYRVVRVSRRRSIPVRLLQFTRQVWRAAQDCDLIFVNGYGLPPAMVNLWLRKPMALKVVSDFAWEFCERHGWISDPVLTFQVRRYHLRVEFMKAVRRWYVSRANQIIVPGNYIRKLVRRWGIPEANIRVIYNAFHSIESIPSVTKNEARRGLGLSDSGALLVTVGRLIPLKRIDWIIRAVASWENVDLVVVGDGPARQYLEAMKDNLGLGSRVMFAGKVSPDVVLLYLRAADAFVLSSETEGLPHVILEAMAVGTPLVATAVGGVPELIEHEQSGLLVSPDDEMALREQIQRVLTDRSLVTRMVTRSQEKAHSLFGWDRLVDETERVFCWLAGQRRAGG
jgi:glycosyltransferase involved in cell wall biosynthesis